MSTYDRITAHILQTLTRGVVPWHRPWTVGMPRNVISLRPYRGINVWLTASAGFTSPDWLTFNQAYALGGSIQKGAKGTPVVLWTWCDAERDGDATEARRVPLVRSYTVFNVEQTTGIDLPVDSDRPTFQPIARGEAIVASMPQRPSVPGMV
jgi:antirestriction protein ArdC